MDEESERSYIAEWVVWKGFWRNDRYLVNGNVDATDDSSKYVWNQELEACTVKALFIGRNETEDNIGFVNSISGESGAIGIVLDKSSFYAEAGGQTFDTGVMKTSSGAVIRVENVQVYGPFVLHLGTVIEGAFTIGDLVTCSVDYVRRAPLHRIVDDPRSENACRSPRNTKRNGKEPTATVDQKGSLVDDTKLCSTFLGRGPHYREVVLL
jgi:alanyl-tRNA synthetase